MSMVLQFCCFYVFNIIVSQSLVQLTIAIESTGVLDLILSHVIQLWMRETRSYTIILKIS